MTVQGAASVAWGCARRQRLAASRASGRDGAASSPPA